MLISCVADEGQGAAGEGERPLAPPPEPIPPYQAAEELFERMATDSKFDPDGEFTCLSTRFMLP